MNYTILFAIVAVGLVAIILIPRLKMVAAKRPMLVNLSTVGENRTVESLMGDDGYDAFFCGNVAVPYALLFVDKHSSALTPAKGWKPVPSAEAMGDIKDRLGTEDARLRAAATAQDADGKRTVLGFLYSPGSSAPMPVTDNPGLFTIAPVAPFKPKDPRR